MSKAITIQYADHTIAVTPYGPGYSVKITGPLVVARAGTFAGTDDAVEYAKGRVDGDEDDQ